MLSCKETARIISSREELGFVKKLKLSIHLFLCKNCSNYYLQMKALAESASTLVKNKMQRSKGKIEEVEQEVLTKQGKNNI